MHEPASATVTSQPCWNFAGSPSGGLFRAAWSARIPISLRVHSLREESGNRLGASVARLSSVGEAAVSVEIELPARVEPDSVRPASRLRILKAGSSPVTVRRLEIRALELRWQELDRALAGLLGKDHFPAAGPDSGFAGSDRAAGIWAALGEALERSYAVRIARCTESVPAGGMLFEGGVRLAECPDGSLELSPPAGGAWRALFGAGIELELALPVLDKKRWAACSGILPRCRASAAGPGLVELVPDLDPASPLFTAVFRVLATAAGASSPAFESPEIVFWDDSRPSPVQAEIFLPRLLDAYGIPRDILEAGPLPAAVRLSVSMPGAAAAIWREAPKERTKDHARLFGLLAHRIQERLRQWLPYLIFRDARLLEDRDRLAALAVYAAGRPAPRGKRSEPVYDPMNPAAVQRACRSARSGLPELQEALERAAGAAGAGSTAEYLQRRSPAQLAAGVCRGTRSFLHLLEADCTALETLVALGNQCRCVAADAELEAGRPPRFLWRAAAEVEKRFRKRFRRLLGAAGLSHLGVLLVIEATAVLGAAFGSAFRPEVFVEMEYRDGSRRLFGGAT